ncbi:MAG: class I SAM-dependent methyltransferase [Candidatus Pacebacteria bacterium]|nr:class I SAM-dependent methyltransferase [Candidatus Paceibacterota bacterium]
MLDIVNKLDLRNKNILDIGCYDGTFLSLIENRNNNFYGIDANDYAVRKAKEKGINVKKFFFNDESKIPFENNFFDLIIAGEIIEHIYDTDFFLDEIYRLLKKDGFLILSTPNLASFGRRLMLLLGINPIIECSPNEKDSSGHIRYFTFKTLEHLLRKHRFNIVLKRSDLVNFTRNGKIKSYFLANNIKSIGQSIVCFCDKQ